MSKTEDQTQRRLLLSLSLIANLGILGFFKYFNFFIDSTAELLTVLGLHPNLPVLKVLLPVGISFYTFQTLSYTIDIYKKQITPTKDVLAFFTFVSFFPQLVAGPIERAKSLLPQFLSARSFDKNKAIDGIRQIFWGLFKKIIIADNVAYFVNAIFSDVETHSGLEAFIGVFLFAIQIYCDFSGYSDIAIGTARLFGFNLMRNFAYPYFSRDIGEFWRRWHISLSSWFRDYVYIPLGGSRTKTIRRIWNIVVTFTISGLWHGANWTFVIWGLLNGLYYIPLMLSNKHKANTNIVAEGKLLPSIKEFFQMGVTFIITLFAWIFFRAQSINHAFIYIKTIFTSAWDFTVLHLYATPILISLIMLFIEWLQRDKQHAMDIEDKPVLFRYAAYIIVILSISIITMRNYFLLSIQPADFIYFQF